MYPIHFHNFTLTESQKIQWWREIKKHAPKLAARSMIYDSRRDDNSIEKLESSELVLTTYSEIVKSLPQPDPQQIKKWRESGLDIPYKTSEWSGKNFKRGGDLHKVKWYRVSNTCRWCLDEQC